MDRRRGTAPQAPSVRGSYYPSMYIYTSKAIFSNCIGLQRCRLIVSEDAWTSSILTVCGLIVIGDVTGLDSVACSGVCEVGHYCEPGAVSATNAPCPAGSYGASTGEHNLLEVYHALRGFVALPSTQSHPQRTHVEACSTFYICVRPGYIGMQWPLPGRLLLSDGKQRPNGSALRYVKTNARLVCFSKTNAFGIGDSCQACNPSFLCVQVARRCTVLWAPRRRCRSRRATTRSAGCQPHTSHKRCVAKISTSCPQSFDSVDYALKQGRGELLTRRGVRCRCVRRAATARRACVICVPRGSSATTSGFLRTHTPRSPNAPAPVLKATTARPAV